MNIRRIIQLLFTSFLSQGITVITQLLIPPFFLLFYANGIAVYGEWLALSAAVGYLGTLNWGIQTYANNETTILYNRGDVDGAKTVQASAFRLLFLLIVLFALVGTCAFFLPVASLLNLKHVSSKAASLTALLLALQIGVAMFFGMTIGSYMVVGRLHRGQYWGSAQRLFSVLSMATAIFFKSSFPVLAGVQLSSYLIFLVVVLVDLRFTAPVLVPSFRYGNWKTVGAIIKPSAHFGILATAGFLTWQGPVLIIVRVLGGGAVGVFGLVRVIFQMARQILMIASGTIAQDITLLCGQQNWRVLRRLYDLSERVVLFLTPIVTIGSLLLAPFLFTVWLHKRSVYDPLLCLLMAMVSAVQGIKEHKTQFQQSSNEHEKLSVFMLTGYCIMLLVGAVVMHFFGLPGFILTWLIWEIIQTAYIIRLNDGLFPPEFAVTVKPVVHLAIFMSIAFAISGVLAYWEASWPLAIVVAVAVCTTTLFGIAAYFVFGVDEIRTLLTARWKRRFAPNSTSLPQGADL
jgi:O-antigen/teichoic acid export membrane protein